jgi:signal transduction histidine kinase
VLNFSGFIHAGFFTPYFVQIGSAMEMLLLAFALADRFNTIRRQAIRDVRDVNASLEARLKMREVELNTIHQRLRTAEQRTLLSSERQRMTQDMHDGLGSSLVSALHAVEKGKLNGNAVSDVLRNCIDDLKLAIDSMEVVDADLLLLLATLRFRLAPRLASAGIRLSWEIGEVPELNWLTPSNSLHILRILQEAFSNILKHAQASEIRVATMVNSHGVTVSVANNGAEFDVTSALQQGGKGLRNQVRRAQSIGGTVSYESNASGTVLCLLLPLQLGESTETRNATAQT